MNRTISDAPISEAVRGKHRRGSRRRPRSASALDSEDSLLLLESLVAEVRAHPGKFPDAPAIVTRAGLGPSHLCALFRRHYHVTPREFLKRAKVDAAKQLLLADEMQPAKIARSLGYQASADFLEDFRTLTGLAPAAYRKLLTDRRFSIELPEGYPLGYLRRALGRDPQSLTERLVGDTYTAAIRLGTEPQLLTLAIHPRRVEASIGKPTDQMPRVPSIVAGLLGLGQPASEFALLAVRLGLERLIEGRPQLRISQTHSFFDGLMWAIIGQQINFAFACKLKRRLIERAGTSIGDELFAPPTPEAVAALEAEELLPFQFSRQKADYLISISRVIANGRLDLEGLRSMSATRVERTLLAIRGLGPWSVNYLMMRSLGFADCLPLGDTGVTSGLVSLFRLKQRPDAEKTRRLMSRFSPFRSLATAHLWQLDRPLP